MKYKFLIFLFDFVILLGIVLGEMPTKVTLASMESADSYSAQRDRKIYEEAFKRLNIPLTILPVPPARGTIMADTGAVTGETSRAFEYQDLQKNLIRVEEPILEFRRVVYAMRPLMVINGYDSLKGTACTKIRSGV